MAVDEKVASRDGLIVEAPPTNAMALTEPTGLGDSVRRIEDCRFLKGVGRFVDDIVPSQLLHGVVVRSPHAHARITGIDVRGALSARGVRLVLTHDDLAEAGLGVLPLDLAPPGSTLDAFADREQPLLAHGVVRYVGEPVAFIVADTALDALDAAEQVEVEYEALDIVASIGAVRARSHDRSGAGEDADVAFAFEQGDGDAVDMFFSEAADTYSATVSNNRVHAVPIEPRGAIGMYDRASDTFTLHVSTQRVHVIQRALADRVFKIDRARMRVIAPDTGGGFGQKNGLYGEYVLCLEAARRLGRPVKWIATRAESLSSDNHGRDNEFDVEMALNAQGRVTAVRATRFVNMGAYAAPRGMVPVANGLTHLTGVYRVDAAHAKVIGVATNTMPTSPYRGAGRPENVYCCERMIDIVARRKGIDPIAFRRRNLVGPADGAWMSPLGTPFKGVDAGAVLDAALRRADHAGFAARQDAALGRGRLRGFGVALFAEDLHGSAEPITVELAHRDGRLWVRTGTGSAGHGHETSFAQIVAAHTGLPLAAIGFEQSDTAIIKDGIGTAASWSMTLGGSSAMLAAAAAVEKASAVAALLLAVDAGQIALEEGLFRARGTNRVVGWSDIFEAEPGFVATGVFEGHGNTVSVGCHACEVEVDPETGGVEIAGFVVAQDCGRAINPLLVAGQLHGGVAQGVGQGWVEKVVYDPQDGQLLTGTLTDYALPRAADLPMIDTVLHEMPGADNPLGVKGIGESAATGATPAFVNAVLDALAPLGIEDIAPPLTPLAIWQAIAAARA